MSNLYFNFTELIVADRVMGTNIFLFVNTSMRWKKTSGALMLILKSAESMHGASESEQLRWPSTSSSSQQRRVVFVHIKQHCFFIMTEPAAVQLVPDRAGAC
ncbi:unnamed protein product [Amoebophrya sp. A120]|nr:unnamed protein product [Amoebophrya sp. A120]|eukprot:GSA120T00001956001.1